ncbi:MAG: transporter substrate-binding domain-containing protein [Hahellaceae bacterium]|nr:transporter substrate-binding domain-containing protein [Hahellaceae bacterium]
MAGLLMSLASGHVPAVETAQSVTLVADVWCPYNCAPDSVEQGYLIDIATLVFSRLGKHIDYRVMPWSRALHEVSEERATAAVGATRSGMTTGVFVNEVSLGQDQTVLVSRLDRPMPFHGVESLAALDMLGVIAEYTYDAGGPIDRYLQDPKVKKDLMVLYGETALSQFFRLLDQRRVDAFLENRYVALYNARQLGMSENIRLEDTGGGDTIHFAFRDTPKGHKLARQFDEALLELDKEGKIEPILKRYGLDYSPLKRQSSAFE